MVISMDTNWFILFSSLQGLIVRQLSQRTLDKFLTSGWMLWGEYPSYNQAINRICEIGSK
jgi:hypothetical protein